MTNPFYPFSAFVNLITSFIVSIFVLSRNYKLPLNRSFVYFSSSVAFWSFFYFLWQISKDKAHALLWCQVLMAGAIFIPSTFFHFSTVLINTFQKYKKFVLCSYLISAFFLITDATSLFVKDVRPRLSFLYWPTAGSLFFPFLIFFIGVVLLAHVFMFRYYNNLSGIKRNQVKYVFLGTAMGFIGGVTNYPLWFDIPILPIGNIFVSVYVFLVAFAIIKYRLMDIRLAISNTVIFIIVYALVLGVPFGLAILGKPWLIKAMGENWFLVPMASLLVLATVGPFILFYLQRKAEDQLLKEERTILGILKKGAREIPHIKDIQHLLKFITHNLQTLSVNYIAIYLWDIESNSYNLKDSVPAKPNVLTVAKDDALILELKEKRGGRAVNYLNYDEIQFLAQDGNHSRLQKITPTMEGLSAQVIIPMIDDDVLLGFIVLGKREENKSYSDELMGVLTSIGTLVGSSIADNFYWEKMGLQERGHHLIIFPVQWPMKSITP